MLNKKIIDEYHSMTPSDKCREKIMSRARELDARRQAAKRPFVARMRPMLAAAACCLVLLVGVAAAMPALIGGNAEISIDGSELTSGVRTVTPQTVEYKQGLSIALFGRNMPSQADVEIMNATNCIPFELDFGESVVVSVADGRLLVWDSDEDCYIDYGNETAFAGKCRVCWQLPETGENTEWKMSLTLAGREITVSARCNAAGGYTVSTSGN